MARTLPLLLGCALAGLIGALTASFFLANDQALPAPEPARTETDPRVDDLVLVVANLGLRLETLESDPSGPVGIRSQPAEGAPDAPADESTLAATAQPPDAIKEKMREVIAEDQKNRSEVIGRRFAAQAVAREKAMLDSLTEEQGLTPYQREEMERILARRRQAVGEFFRNMFSPGQSEEAPDFAAIRKKIEDVRTESDTELKTLLSPTQYEAFVEQDPQQRMGPMGMGRPGGGASGR